MSRPVLAADELLKRILSQDIGSRSSYRACYMSWVDGFVTDPRLMLISLDDHMVHRGDGVFEALKVVNSKPYLLMEHLERLKRSAASISLELPMSLLNLKELVFETLKVSGLDQAIMRIFVSRGSGSFSPNPYDCKTAGLSIVATELKPVANEKYLNGVKIGKSQLAPKASIWAGIKSCNYLPNVMMKKESVDRGLEFTVGFDELGHLAESATENIILIDESGRLIRPHLHRILKGCTMTRVLELADAHQLLPTVSGAEINESILLRAQEVMMVGTTLDVLPVTEYEGKKIGNGKVGPLSKKLNELLLKDQA